MDRTKVNGHNLEATASTAAVYELIDARELARRWKVSEKWIRSRTRASTPPDHRIPAIYFGRYCRFEWASPQLLAWLQKQRR